MCSCAGILGSRFCPRGSNPAAWVLQSGGMCLQSHPSEPEPGKQSALFSFVIYLRVRSVLVFRGGPLKLMYKKKITTYTTEYSIQNAETHVHKTIYGPVIDSALYIMILMWLFWATNGTRLSARCLFSGPKIFLISRVQLFPTCPRIASTHLRGLRYDKIPLQDCSFLFFFILNGNLSGTRYFVCQRRLSVLNKRLTKMLK